MYVRAALTSAITAAIITTAIEACSKLSPAPTAGGPANGVEQQHFTEVATCKSGPGVGGINAGDDDLKLAYANFGEKVEIPNTRMDFTDLAEFADAWLEGADSSRTWLGETIYTRGGEGILTNPLLNRILKKNDRFTEVNSWSRWDIRKIWKKLPDLDSPFHSSPIRTWIYGGISYDTSHVNYILQGHAHARLLMVQKPGSSILVEGWNIWMYGHSAEPGERFWADKGIREYPKRNKW